MDPQVSYTRGLIRSLKITDGVYNMLLKMMLQKAETRRDATKQGQADKAQNRTTDDNRKIENKNVIRHIA
jgi:hypothetical protein